MVSPFASFSFSFLSIISSFLHSVFLLSSLLPCYDLFSFLFLRFQGSGLHEGESIDFAVEDMVSSRSFSSAFFLSFPCLCFLPLLLLPLFSSGFKDQDLTNANQSTLRARL